MIEKLRLVFLACPACGGMGELPAPASRASLAVDVLVALTLAVAAAAVSFHASGLLGPALYDEQGGSFWFEADVNRAFVCMTDRTSPLHYRSKVHPLFALIEHPPTLALMKIAHLTPMTASRLVTAGVAGLALALFYFVLRLAALRRLDALLFSLVAGASASAVFWTTVPETYPLGCVTVLAALGYALLWERGLRSTSAAVAASALSLSATVTNWSAGILASFATMPWRKAVNATVWALAVVTMLFGVEKFFIPGCEFFLGSREETRYVARPEAGGPLRVARAFAAHSVVMPRIDTVPKPNAPAGKGLSVQRSGLGSSGRWGAAATALWGVLLAWGAIVMALERRMMRFRLTLALFLAGQLLLHLVYGEETFLYAMHYGPPLVIVAAFAASGRGRWIVRALAALLLGALVMNNSQQFAEARRALGAFNSPRAEVRSAMLARPGDDWPRGAGHVILAEPGTPAECKSYLEPGGSFSPSVGSFGVSIRVLDAQGRKIATSDSIPLADVRQRFEFAPTRDLPAIVNETPYYAATWSRVGGYSALKLERRGGEAHRLMVMLRSVGPAGGPVTSLDGDAGALVVNKRWRVAVTPKPESDPVIGSEVSGALPDPSGWGFAHFALSGGGPWKVELRDLMDLSVPPLVLRTANKPQIDLPDARFVACLEAQVAHLKMGLVDAETRPGDPMNYPLNWLRDGAYVIVALARAGEVDQANRLVDAFARQDFFGGFGAEADAPGLALWALGEVSRQANDPSFDRKHWRDVARKVGLILEMLDAKAPVRKPFAGPVVPAHRGKPDLDLVCEPARDGLIVGRMDWQRPILFVNAVSWMGLVEAAAFAERSGHADEARPWRERAAALRTAWEAGLRTKEADNDRTAICGLWPTGIASGVKSDYEAALDRRWRRMHYPSGDYREPPLWTYFEAADAHQWLLLGRRDRLGATLAWFFDHQRSPGLFTWGEGKGEENSFGLWESVRGWVRPDCVTPHYWTAAEVLLLQLDMLACVDDSGPEPVVVIGAGVPDAWLASPMSVTGLRTSAGTVDWSWRDGCLSVTLHDSRAAVRPGPAFGADVRLVVTRA